MKISRQNSKVVALLIMLKDLKENLLSIKEQIGNQEKTEIIKEPHRHFKNKKYRKYSKNSLND